MTRTQLYHLKPSSPFDTGTSGVEPAGAVTSRGVCQGRVPLGKVVVNDAARLNSGTSCSESLEMCPLTSRFARNPGPHHRTAKDFRSNALSSLSHLAVCPRVGVIQHEICLVESDDSLDLGHFSISQVTEAPCDVDHSCFPSVTSQELVTQHRSDEPEVG
ncbi:hypothetical protein L798_11839 [Zootermopsis nevadensis]|uniref:Uncharacterized protein n=1 Tax=Zootermopsis nevadensis TaxID=136037 RepID=A0A067R4F4_ZOONE|nr:hypothetical protein L798_11839 [Zootermopsis nevadensis]